MLNPNFCLHFNVICNLVHLFLTYSLACILDQSVWDFYCTPTNALLICISITLLFFLFGISFCFSKSYLFLQTILIQYPYFWDNHFLSCLYFLPHIDPSLSNMIFSVCFFPIHLNVIILYVCMLYFLLLLLKIISVIDIHNVKSN